MDLLIKYIGPESSIQANSMKTANFGDSREGLSRIRERLDDRYESPEMVGFSLKKKTCLCAKTHKQRQQKVYELINILCEIEDVKENIN